MKKLLLSLLIVISIPCVAQKYNFPVNQAGKIEFTQTLEVPLSKEKLFANAQQWIVDTFKDYKSAVQVEDKENGKLIVGGVSEIEYRLQDYLFTHTEEINYTITIECRDNKYRYTISNLNITKILNSRKNKIILPDYHLQNIDEWKKESNLLCNKLDSVQILQKEERNDHKKRNMTNSLVITKLK